MYFIKKSLIEYFIIIESPNQSNKSKLNTVRLIKIKEELFIKLEKNYENIKGDIEE